MMLARRIQAITPDQLLPSIKALFLLIIVLQVVDAVSTHYALVTGVLYEQNQLLNVVAHFSQLHIMQVVVVAKMLVAGMFFLAMLRAKPSWTNLFLLFAVAAFYIDVVVNNMTQTAQALG